MSVQNATDKLNEDPIDYILKSSIANVLVEGFAKVYK